MLLLLGPGPGLAEAGEKEPGSSLDVGGSMYPVIGYLGVC